MYLYKVRHGRSLLNERPDLHSLVEDEYAPLVRLGVKQAQAAGRFFKDHFAGRGVNLKDVAIWHSPMYRAQLTAEHMAEAMGYGGRLYMQQHMGEHKISPTLWMSAAEVIREHPGKLDELIRALQSSQGFDVACPFGGEDNQMFLGRIRQVREDLLAWQQDHNVQHVIAVSHGGVMRAWQWLSEGYTRLEDVLNIPLVKNCTIQCYKRGGSTLPKTLFVPD